MSAPASPTAAAPETMRAITYTSYGGPEVMSLERHPTPLPGANEVQIRVHAAGLNPVDKIQRSGAFKAILPYTLPVIAGNEFSGHISALGTGVSGWAIGDPVVCRVRKDAMGALGEYAVQPAELVARAPKDLDLADAAGLPLAGLTALQVLDTLDVKSGDRLLITGGSGGVGLFAIQLAKIRGAYVFTTASSAGREHVIRAGADEVIDYKTTKLVDYEPINGGKWTKVFDAAGGEDAMINDVIPSLPGGAGGHIVSVAAVPTPGIFDNVLSWWKRPLVNALLGYKAGGVVRAARDQGVKYEYVFMRPDGAQLGELVKLVNESRLRVVVDERFGVDRFKEAFERLESGRSKGKVIITFQ